MFEEFFEKIEWNQEAVAMHNLYSPAQIFSMTYAKIDKCGLYQDDWRKWSRKTQSDKTWGNFKAHFDWAFKETWRSSRTLKNKGYASHVHTGQANAKRFTEMQQDHTLEISNIATATQTNRTTVLLLTKTVLELSGQVALLTAKLATAQAENARMKKSGQKPTTAGHGHRMSSNTTLQEPNPSQDRNLYS